MNSWKAALQVYRDVMGSMGNIVNNITTVYSDGKLLDFSWWPLYKVYRCQLTRLYFWNKYNIVCQLYFHFKKILLSTYCWKLFFFLMVFHRVPWVYQKNVVSHQEVPWFIWSYCFVPKPTKHHFLFSHDTDHRPSNSSFHPNFLEKCPVGFRTTDSVVGDAIWQSRTHWICDIAPFYSLNLPHLHDHVCCVVEKIIIASKLKTSDVQWLWL